MTEFIDSGHRLGMGSRPCSGEERLRRLDIFSHPLVHAASKAGASGTSKSLVGYGPSIYDQGGSSTCVMHAHAWAYYAYLAATSMGLGFVVSPLLLAQCVYGAYRAEENVGADLPPLIDGGASNGAAIAAASEWGIGPMGPRVGGRNSDVPDSGDFPEADNLALQNAAYRLAVGEYAIEPYNAALTVRKLVACIDAHIPVVRSGTCGSHFQNAQMGTIIGADSTGGGHDTVIAGYHNYDPARPELTVFELVNSWGPMWCDHGVGLVNVEFVLASNDLCPTPIATVAA